MSSYRDEREATHARAEALERENHELRRQLEALRTPTHEKPRVFRWIVAGAVATTLLLGIVAFLVLARADLVPPDIDSPPGVFGTLHLEVSPASAAVRVDDRSWETVEHAMNFTRLDPNHPHRVEVTAPGYDSAVRYVVVPAHGVRRERIELRLTPNP